MIKRFVLALAALSLATGATAASADTGLKLWRLDCGTVENSDLDMFADDYALEGKRKTITDSCYLIRHGDSYMLWDAGLGLELLGRNVEMVPGVHVSLKRSLVDQLGEIGVRPDQITFLGISHLHFDHMGQASAFPKAKLLIGASDWSILTSPTPDKLSDPKLLDPWIKAGGARELITGDKDVFGDGSVIMLTLPGHTPGHFGLLVRLKQTGAVLLTGDLYHVEEERVIHAVPRFNLDRTDTLSSQHRFDSIAHNLAAKVIIQHEPADIAKLPAFPNGAE